MLRLAFITALCPAILPNIAASQSVSVLQVPGYCIPPAPPLLDDASLEVLGMTAGAELSRYMDEAQSYSLCLDATKQQLYQEVSQYLQQYREAVQ